MYALSSAVTQFPVRQLEDQETEITSVTLRQGDVDKSAVPKVEDRDDDNAKGSAAEDTNDKSNDEKPRERLKELQETPINQSTVLEMRTEFQENKELLTELMGIQIRL